jgi:hypothetical protein
MAKGTVEDYTFAYERLLTYEDGTSKAEGVTIKVPERSGRGFTLTARNATRETISRHGGGRGREAVTATVSHALASATPDNGEGIVRVPERATSRDSTPAAGATFDRGRDVLWLSAGQDRRGVDPNGQGAMDVSGTAGFLPRPLPALRATSDPSRRAARAQTTR